MTRGAPTATELPVGLRGFLLGGALPLTLCDLEHPDCAITLANDAFYRLSGYGEAETIGRNCRFLQPKGGAGPVRDRIKRLLIDPTQTEGRFLLPNCRKDGRNFLNLLYITKLRLGGCVRYVLGSQFDVSKADQRSSLLFSRALEEDLQRINMLGQSGAAVVLGSFDALAHSAAAIAEHRGNTQ